MKTRRLFSMLVMVAAVTAPATASADPVAPVGVSGDVPLALSLSLGTIPTLGSFVPGVTADYATTAVATVTSTAASALLTIADLTGASPAGHLLNGAFSLPSAVKASGTSSVTSGVVNTPLTAVGASPLTLVSYSTPVTNDSVTVGLSQHIGSTDGLRTGTYSKILTLTLSSTSP